MASKVMLVEDDNNLREIYEARLQAEGYTIVSAQDGEEALVVAKNEKPDLIISDVMMPKISGFEMLDILRNTDGLKDVKIIMLTALGQAEDKTRADALGANKYLVKSQVTLEDIVTTTHQLLDDPNNVTAAATTPAAPAEPTAPTTPVPTTVAVPVTSEPTTPQAATTSAPTTPAPEPSPISAPTTAVDVSIPVATEPLSTPTATPEPTAVVATPAVSPAPVATPKPAQVVSMPPVADLAVPDTAAADVAASPTAAQETATMKTQIEDFVKNQPSPTATATANDKTMSDAVNDMVADTDAKTPSDVSAVDVSTPAPSVPSVPTATSPVAPVPAAEAAPADVPEGTPAQQETFGSVPIAHKKSIQPLNSVTKPDINALLAAEEAKTAVPTPDSTIEIAPTSPPTPSAGDPNNIAL